VTANAILKRGGTIVMYVEGGRSRSGQLADRPRRGIGRLVLDSGAPVLPVAIHGSSRVRNWKRLQFPQVSVTYGDLIRFDAVPGSTHEQQLGVAEQVFAEIKSLYGAT
jgi:1-acyl-sn-glycerol-3-phosphate acyltransferase